MDFLLSFALSVSLPHARFPLLILGNPLDHPDNNNPLYASGGQGDTSFYDSQPGPDNSLYDEATGTGGDIDL